MRCTHVVLNIPQQPLFGGGKWKAKLFQKKNSDYTNNGCQNAFESSELFDGWGERV